MVVPLKGLCLAARFRWWWNGSRSFKPLESAVASATQRQSLAFQPQKKNTWRCMSSWTPTSSDPQSPFLALFSDPDYIITKPTTIVTHDPERAIAISIRTVGYGKTDDEFQLARVSLVDYHGNSIYDTYVIPQLPVTTYKMEKSVIEPCHLAADAGAQPFTAVQEKVQDLISGRVLIGYQIHRAEVALQLEISKFDKMDVTSIHRSQKLRKNMIPLTLKCMTSNVLGLDLPEESTSCVEDARAVMLLVRRDKVMLEQLKEKKREDAEKRKREEDRKSEQRRKSIIVKRKSTKRWKEVKLYNAERRAERLRIEQLEAIRRGKWEGIDYGNINRHSDRDYYSGIGNRYFCSGGSYSPQLSQVDY